MFVRALVAARKQFLFFLSFLLVAAQVFVLICASGSLFPYLEVEDFVSLFFAEAALFSLMRCVLALLKRFLPIEWVFWGFLALGAVGIAALVYGLEYGGFFSGWMWRVGLFVFVQSSVPLLLSLFLELCVSVLRAQQKLLTVYVMGSLGGVCAAGVAYLLSAEEPVDMFWGVWLLLGFVGIVFLVLYFCPCFFRVSKSQKLHFRAQKFLRFWTRVSEFLRLPYGAFALSALCSLVLAQVLYYLANKGFLSLNYAETEHFAFFAAVYFGVFSLDLVRVLFLPLLFRQGKISYLLFLPLSLQILLVLLLPVLPELVFVLFAYFLWWSDRGIFSFFFVRFFVQPLPQPRQRFWIRFFEGPLRVLGLLVAGTLVWRFASVLLFPVLVSAVLCVFVLCVFVYRSWVKMLEENFVQYRCVAENTLFSKRLQYEFSADFLYFSRLMENSSDDLCVLFLSRAVRVNSPKMRRFLRVNFQHFSVRVQVAAVRMLAYMPESSTEEFLRAQVREAHDAVRVAVISALPVDRNVALEEANRILNEGRFYPEYKCDAFLYVFQYASAYQQVKLSNRLLAYAHFGDDEEKYVAVSTSARMKNLDFLLELFPSLRSQSLLAYWLNLVLPYVHKLETPFLESCVRLFDDATWTVREKCLRLFRMIDCREVFPQLMRNFEYARENEQLALLDIADIWTLFTHQDILALLEKEYLPLAVFVRIIQLWQKSHNIPQQFRDYKLIEEYLYTRINQAMNCYCVLEEEGHQEALLIQTLIHIIRTQLHKAIIWNLFKPQQNISEPQRQNLLTKILTHNPRSPRFEFTESDRQISSNTVRQYIKLSQDPTLWKNYYIQDPALSTAEQVFEHLIFESSTSWLVAVSIYSSQFLPHSYHIAIEKLYTRLERQVINYSLIRDILRNFKKEGTFMLSIFNKIAVFEKIELFAPLSFPQLQLLADISEVHECSARDIIVHTGQSDENMYIIEQGTLQIHNHTHTKLMNPGYFGTLNLFGTRKHPHKIEALEDSRLIIIHGEQFRKILHKSEVLFQIFNLIIDEHLFVEEASH